MAHGTIVAELADLKTSLALCILDDDLTQLDLLSELIAELGYQAVPTFNPEEALQYIEDGRCRLF